ncbi:copper resistance CopC family protein [Rhizohabitans arisaemae]|uniref:copper resistance CopC family protein n=1 Tax=Rhizohabitans arisaemae TaxID=2720610 RepID=UPI0024B261B3|nr:copper resistance CopC family protein [Rhizohabitans arisaemae]
MRRLLTVLILAWAGVAWLSAPANAHNVLIDSDPKKDSSVASAPRSVTLVFDQPARQGFAQVTVTGPGGTRWEQGPVKVSGAKVTSPIKPLGPAGKYVIGYRVLSSDGHPISGTVRFTLTAPGPGASPPPASPSASSPGSAAGSPSPSTAPVAVQEAPPAQDLSAEAAEAAQNGGAGVAVAGMAVAILLLGVGTVVALRRGRPAPSGDQDAKGASA